MFLGLALMQWVSGLAASTATAYGADPLSTVFATVSALLLAGTLAFVLLPWPPGSRMRAGSDEAGDQTTRAPRRRAMSSGE